MKIPEKKGSDSDAAVVEEVFTVPSADFYLSLKKKKKKKSHNIKIEAGTQEIESENISSMIKSERNDRDSCSSGKKKHKISESSLSVIEDSFASTGKKKIKHENSLSIEIEDSFKSTASSGKKKKRKSSENGANESLPSVIEDSFDSIKNKKRKHSTNDDSECLFIKKKKHNDSEMLPLNGTESECSSIIKKEKHKNKKHIDSENFENQLPDSDKIIKKNKKKKRQKDSENDDSQSTVDTKKKHEDSEIVFVNETESEHSKKRRKKKHRESENNESQSNIEPEKKHNISETLSLNETDSNIIKKKKKKRQKNSESDEIEASLLTIDSNGSFVEKKKHKSAKIEESSLSFDEIEPSLLTIDSDGSFIKKRKSKNLENQNFDDSLFSMKKEKIGSDEVKSGKTRKIIKSEDFSLGNDDSFCHSTPKKHRKSTIKTELTNSTNGLLDESVIKQENVSSVKIKQEKLSPSQESSKNYSEANNSVDDYQLKLAVSELSKDVSFEVPELHKILNRSSKATTAQRALLKSKGLQAKRGKFTKDEDRKIIENWESLVEMAGIEDNPQLFFCMKNTRIPPLAKQNFLYYLSKDLPDRIPSSVFIRFKLLMADVKKGRFTEEEDDYIKSIISTTTTSNRPVKEMAEHLKRSRLAVEHRILKLLKEHSRKIKWRKNNAATFIKYLLRATDCSEVAELRNRPIIKSEWEYLSKKLDGVPVRILVRVWKEKLHPALFIRKNQLDLRKVKMKLVKMFKENEETDWKRVNWSRYAARFKGLTSLRVYSLLKQIVVAYVPKKKRGNLKKCIKILSKMPEENLYKHILYKMVYKDGAVREIKGS